MWAVVFGGVFYKSLVRLKLGVHNVPVRHCATVVPKTASPSAASVGRCSLVLLVAQNPKPPELMGLGRLRGKRFAVMVCWLWPRWELRSACCFGHSGKTLYQKGQVNLVDLRDGD